MSDKPYGGRLPELIITGPTINGIPIQFSPPDESIIECPYCFKELTEEPYQCCGEPVIEEIKK